MAFKPSHKYGNIECLSCGCLVNPIHANDHICMKPSTQEMMDKVAEEMRKMLLCSDCGCDNKHRYWKDHISVCWSCEEKRKVAKKKKWLADRKYTMSLEERIAEIESWMYDSINNPRIDPLNVRFI